MQRPMIKDCGNCTRERVCYVLGECFLEHPQIKTLPSFLNKQIQNARSVRQALQVFKLTKYAKKRDQQEIQRP